MDPITTALAVNTVGSVVGGMMSDKSASDAAARNAALQKEFAKKGIQWKVADAKKAGISPEFALGGSTTSFTPTETGGKTGDMIADAGQNIARAALATGTQADREMDAQMKAETLRGMKLQNDKIDPALTSINRPGNPPFPHPNGNVFPGQGNSPVVKDVALERTGQSPSAPHSEGGSIPAVGWMNTPDGGLRPVPSQDVKNRIEDQLIPETVWATQNLVAPNFEKGPKPPKEALPKGAKSWRWSVSRQAYYPSSKSHRNFGDRAYEWYESAKDRWSKPIPRRR